MVDNILEDVKLEAAMIDGNRVEKLKRKLQLQREADQRSEAFASWFGVRRMKWSAWYLSRFLKIASVDRYEIILLRKIFGDLGMGHREDGERFGRLNTGGVFDHGELWGRLRVPVIWVGHPYRITDDERLLLDELHSFDGIDVGVDDRESYYGHGTHHVRVALAGSRWPGAEREGDGSRKQEAS